MDANTLPSPLCLKPPSFLHSRPSLKTQTILSPRPVHLQLPRLRATGPGDPANSINSSSSNDNDENPNTADVAPPIALNIKYPRRSRKRATEKQEQSGGRKAAVPKKEWESMSLGEKAAELYVGEKGLLFWLNKLAYASIFAIIGGWILFRFVGPSLGLYQLDTPPLAPTAIFKG